MELGHVFPMAAGAIKTGWLTALFGGMLVLWMGLFFFLTYMINGAARAEIALRGDKLVVRGGVYGRDIPLAAINAGEAKRVDLGRKGPKSLKWRRNGVGLPGLSAGWFRLRDGEKALVFVTDKARAVYVPTTLGYGVVVSPGEPERFLEALRQAAANGVSRQ
ncbi:PH domain-containing protein [Desulfovibrio sp. JY]|nr:PH domain-containing protein [Desulfovibrio sp. JY]